MSRVDSSPAEPNRYPLPCVVQVGFAGSRTLFDVADPNLRAALHAEVKARLIAVLRGLPARLGLSERHFLCGISQMGGAADVLFAEACHEINSQHDASSEITQRVFLPEHLDTYLSPASDPQIPDFPPQRRSDALQFDHVIERRMVSAAPTQAERFVDCNREIIDVSDLVICLIREGTSEGAGSMVDFRRTALDAKKCLFEIIVRRSGDAVDLFVPDAPHHFDQWQVPELPEELQGIDYVDRVQSGPLPSVSEFGEAVADSVESAAVRHSKRFAKAARNIIALHIVATIFAISALLLSFHEPWFVARLGSIFGSVPDRSGLSEIWFWTVIALLIAELLALGAGMWTHLWLHRAHPSHHWALSRLLAEVSRSVRAVEGLHFYPDYLFRVLLPDELRPMLRTLCVLHLRSSPAGKSADDARSKYIAERLTKPFPDGQLSYYRRKHEHARKALAVANRSFIIFALAAIAATSLKVVLKLEHHWAHPAEKAAFTSASEERRLARAGATADGEPVFELSSLMSVFAVVFPVLAVGAMSWAAAMNYESRMQTFAEMMDRLEKQKYRLEKSNTSERHVEFLHHVTDTETFLLSETAQWYSRQRFTGVA